MEVTGDLLILEVSLEQWDILLREKSIIRLVQTDLRNDNPIGLYSYCGEIYREVHSLNQRRQILDRYRIISNVRIPSLLIGIDELSNTALHIDQLLCLLSRVFLPNHREYFSDIFLILGNGLGIGLRVLLVVASRKPYREGSKIDSIHLRILFVGRDTPVTDRVFPLWCHFNKVSLQVSQRLYGINFHKTLSQRLESLSIAPIPIEI